jgi:protein-S-isoprenylcysteine O-methyltransferase Ste14
LYGIWKGDIEVDEVILIENLQKPLFFMSIFTIVFILWGLSEVFLNRFFHSGKSDNKNQDKGTIIIIWLAIAISIALGIISKIYIRLPIANTPLIPYLGLAVLILGMIIRTIAIITLGKYFTVDVTLRKDHKVIREGLYRIIRHPAYSGSLLSFIGFGVTLNNWASLFLCIIPVTTAMLYRIKIEERLLVEHFGSEYEEYKKTTYRLIPWIY